MTSAETLRACILQFVASSGSGAAAPHHEVRDDFDLRLDGAIDSFGFVRLIADLEQRTGQSIDLSDLAPEQFTKLGVLVTHIANQLNARQHGRHDNR